MIYSRTHNNRPDVHSRIRLILISIIVIVSGLILSLTPLGRWLEEDISLSWLFKLRGEIDAPRDVVVVSIDQDSSRNLTLPNKPRKWPRHLHGKLVDQLTQAGASAIAFDIIFEETRDEAHNREFAAALQRANNVVLFQYLRQEMIDMGANGHAVIEKLISPLPVLAENTQGLSPFPLPKVPAKVNHFLLYKPELSDAPTMPVTMLQLHGLSVYDELRAMLVKHLPQADIQLPVSATEVRQQRAIHNITRQLRQLFVQHQSLANLLSQDLNKRELTEQQRQQLAALIYTYSAPHSMYLNFYGAPHTIRTLPFYQVLQADPATLDLAGKAVFVGFSESFQPEQKDGFFTVFTDEDSGVDISGVEIMATAFANLLQRQALHVPSATQDILLIVIWGLLICILLKYVPGVMQIPVALVLGTLYAVTVYFTFARYYIWLPLTTPLLWQLPLATGLTFLWKYLDVQRERRNIRAAFGYHLPVEVVDKLAQNMDHLTQPGEKVQGIVMATDAEQYTHLSEHLDPQQLHSLMNDYYATVFKPVSDHNGIVSDVVGDAVMVIWANIANKPGQHRQACNSALQIQTALELFNQEHPQHSLPTRIGLHAGEIVMGHVGALDHYEYRAIGDIVNTASRIEGLNKYLGTRILVSDAVAQQLDNLQTRYIGRFQLAGKTTALGIYELVGDRATENNTIYKEFEDAVSLVEQEEWRTAMDAFDAILASTSDGPSAFYRQYCEDCLRHPPEHHHGIILLTTK